MTPEEQREYIKAQVSATARQVLGSTASPPLNAPLRDLGVDSLGAVEFRNSLSKRLGIKLSATALFDYPTLDAIIDHCSSMINEKRLTVKPAPELPANAANTIAPLGPGERLAIAGIGCRLPGNSEDPQAFWAVLMAMQDCSREIPLSRWNVDEFYSDDHGDPGKCYVRKGAFVNDVEFFDRTLFGMSEGEAHCLDPQQRIMMEAAYSAIIDAGYDKSALSGSNTGVFIGCCGTDWQNVVPLDKIQAFTGTGGAPSIVANRISFHFGLRGPSFAVDTACSASLVALDCAYEKISLGECEMALCGGVNLMLTPHLFVAFSKARMLAPDGRCKTFDASADGYCRGEGAGAVILKKISAAKGAGDKIWAILRGSSCNHVGKSAGLTAPNGPSQAEVIKRYIY
eukprot:GHVU01016583.1.p1 GENE.GHVU01016583.1~~GHVU01016583.1.p1  ORF type:complete len:452 (+),score=80.51 GHVU01016583.1:161-1357(+)